MSRHAFLGLFFFGFPGCAANADPVTLGATAVQVDGAIRVKDGQACRVHVEPAGGKQGVNCHVSVVCGDVSLFGGKRLGGYADCDTRDHRFLSADDDRPSSQDGDPTLALNLLEGTVEVTDNRPAFRVRLKLHGPHALALLTHPSDVSPSQSWRRPVRSP